MGLGGCVVLGQHVTQDYHFMIQETLILFLLTCPNHFVIELAGQPKPNMDICGLNEKQN